MARIVTSDGIQVNLFLDLDSENTGSGLLLYGPKTQPKMDFIIQGFEDFKINDEYNDEHELVLHTGEDETTVDILTLVADNPTSSNPYVVDSNTNLYFVGNDLVLSRDGEKIHRIDLLKGDVTDIKTLENDIAALKAASTVSSINNKTGDVNISAGSNISIDNSGTNVVINSTGGGNQTVQPNWSTGWVNTDGSTAVDNGATLSFTHNLNSTDVIYHIYAAGDANGTNAVSLDYQNDSMSAFTDQYGAQITDISNDSFKLRLGYKYFIKINDHDGTPTQEVDFTGQYIKVVASSAATSVVDAYTKSETYTKTEIDQLLLNAGGCDDGSILYLKYWFAGDPSTNTDVTDKINLTYPPADFPAGKRLLLTTDVSTGAVGDTQYRTDAYLYIRNDNLEQWDYKDKIDSSFNWELMRPQTIDCTGIIRSAYKSENVVVDLDNWSNNYLNICSFTVPNINDIRTLGVNFEFNVLGVSKLNSGNRWGNYVTGSSILRRIPTQNSETYSNITSWEWTPKTYNESINHVQLSTNVAGESGFTTGIFFIVDNNTNLCTIYSAILDNVVGTTHQTRIYTGALIKILNSSGDNTISNFQWNFTEGPSSLPT